jgi:glycerate kinase
MKVVIAPDSFKESLSAVEAARAIAVGVLAAVGDAQVDLCPMSDGGEGMVEALVAATGGQLLTADVYDPLGGELRARFGVLGGDVGGLLPGEIGLQAIESDPAAAPVAPGQTAVVEMAAASGLTLVPPQLRDPLRTTTYGTGQLIKAALDTHPRRIIIGVGGSATCDGGAGAAQALGAEFYDADGEALSLGLSGGRLAEVATIDTRGLDPRLAETEIIVACDVHNPLLGPEGAAAVYAPQKGADPEGVRTLEAALANLAGRIREQVGVDLTGLPGAGAAGGLAAGLVAFAGANIEPGARKIAELLRLRQRLAGADLCITGEGKLDGQSGYGKLPVRVAELAGEAGVPTLCLAGQVEGSQACDSFAAVHSLVSADASSAEINLAMSHATERLRSLAAQAVGDYYTGGQR